MLDNEVLNKHNLTKSDLDLIRIHEKKCNGNYIRLNAFVKMKFGEEVSKDLYSILLCIRNEENNEANVQNIINSNKKKIDLIIQKVFRESLVLKNKIIYDLKSLKQLRIEDIYQIFKKNIIMIIILLLLVLIAVKLNAFGCDHSHYKPYYKPSYYDY